MNMSRVLQDRCQRCGGCVWAKGDEWQCSMCGRQADGPLIPSSNAQARPPPLEYIPRDVGDDIPAPRLAVEEDRDNPTFQRYTHHRDIGLEPFQAALYSGLRIQRTMAKYENRYLEQVALREGSNADHSSG